MANIVRNVLIGVIIVSFLYSYSVTTETKTLESKVDAKESTIEDLSQRNEEKDKQIQEIEDNLSKTQSEVKDLKNTLANNPSNFHPHVIEREVHRLLNEERTSRGAGRLSFDPDLRETAHDKSVEMAEYGFSHVNPVTGEDYRDIFQRHNYDCIFEHEGKVYFGSENIHRTHWKTQPPSFIDAKPYHNNTELAKGMFQAWMDSDGHRRNMLAEQWNKVGIGVYKTSDDEIFATQHFC